MQAVCEATQSESTDVQVAAFQCLVRIMQIYYDKMRLYMEKALFGVKDVYTLALFYTLTSFNISLLFLV